MAQNKSNGTSNIIVQHEVGNGSQVRKWHRKRAMALVIL